MNLEHSSLIFWKWEFIYWLHVKDNRHLVAHICIYIMELQVESVYLKVLMIMKDWLSVMPLLPALQWIRNKFDTTLSWQNILTPGRRKIWIIYLMIWLGHPEKFLTRCIHFSKFSKQFDSVVVFSLVRRIWIWNCYYVVVKHLFVLTCLKRNQKHFLIAHYKVFHHYTFCKMKNISNKYRVSRSNFANPLIIVEIFFWKFYRK